MATAVVIEAVVPAMPTTVVAQPPANLTAEQLEAVQRAEKRRRAAVAAQEEATKKQVTDDLRKHGCRKAAVAMETLPASLESGEIQNVAEVLHDFGCVHWNHDRLAPETVAAVDVAAEEAAQFLFDRFLETLQGAKELFGSLRHKTGLQRIALENEAHGVLREARDIAFSSFGGPGFAALTRLLASGKLPESVNKRLRQDEDFAVAVNGDGKALLNALLAPPKRPDSNGQHGGGKGGRGKKGK